MWMMGVLGVVGGGKVHLAVLVPGREVFSCCRNEGVRRFQAGDCSISESMGELDDSI